MDYNKNKYNLIKQIGGGIEEYRDNTKPILQSIYTDIAKFSTSQFSGNKTKREALTKLIHDGVSDCIVIQVRGNGLCLLNAVCAAFFIMQRVKNISSLLSQEIPANVHNIETKIPYENQLNISISEYIMIIYRRVEVELIPMSKKIIALIIETMKRGDSSATYNSEEFYDRFEFRRDMNAGTYFYNQLGQILSTFLNCVIILLDNVGLFHGVFPSGETESVSLGNILVQKITDNINRGIWDVIFITNATAAHYYSLIPLVGSGDIKASNIDIYNRIKDTGSIAWN